MSTGDMAVMQEGKKPDQQTYRMREHTQPGGMMRHG